MAILDRNGLVKDQFVDILLDIEDSERANIDSSIYTRDDELLGQLNNIISERIASLNDLSQAVYDSFNIASAEGKNLDDLAALRGVRRAPATFSSGIQTFKAIAGTVIPSGSVLQNSITGDRFVTIAPLNVVSSSSYETTYEVVNVLNSTLYTITINGVEYTYTSDVDATANEIVTGLVADITAGSDSTVSAAVVGDEIVLTATSSTTPISSSTISYIRATSVVSKVGIRSEVVGPIVAPANTITQLASPTATIIETYNEDDLILGSLVETDEALRIRIANTTVTDSTGTIPSITSAILNNVAGVTSVNVIENVLAVTDGDGRPAHSYETIVIGGDDEELAQEIWRTKPAGIGLFGNTTEIITDSVGSLRTIKFTRPVVINLAVRVQYSEYGEELFPISGTEAIRSIVVSQITALGVDKDVIPLRLAGPIYSNVEGIDDLIIEVQQITTSGDTPNPANWQEARFPINVDEFAFTTAIDVYVEEI